MYSAYNYNPYMQNRYMQQPQQIEQPIVPSQMTTSNTMQIRPSLNGKQVDSVEMAKTIEYPLDGTISYFPILDGSAIVTKQMTMDGTSKITVFKPFNEKKETINYITPEDMKKALNELDLSELDDIKDEIKDIKQELKEIKKRKKDD